MRYGYKEVRGDENDFETQLVANLAEFIQTEEAISSNEESFEGHMTVMGTTLGLLLNPPRKDDIQLPRMSEESCTSIVMSNSGDSLQVNQLLHVRLACLETR